jgi:aryl-alcohol dehydrogenase-like predicted oxidoreductase
VSEIGFGCMSLARDHTQNARLLHRTLELGVTFFDTADLYDRGHNKKSVGRAFKGMREGIVIATKVGNRWREGGSGWGRNPSPAHLRRAVEVSLRRLRTD